MLRSPLLTFLVLALAFTADAGEGQPRAKDLYGDPLPPGAVARLGTVRWRHGALVTFAAFLPDGKSVVSAGDDGYIRLWEFPSGKEIRRIVACPPKDNMPGSSSPSGFLISAALSPDG